MSQARFGEIEEAKETLMLLKKEGFDSLWSEAIIKLELLLL